MYDVEVVDITNSRKIQSNPEWYYVVEDYNPDTGMDGCNITYWELDIEGNFYCRDTFSFSYPEEALQIGKAMVEFANNLLEKSNG